ncbi:mitochondrial carrier, partial [Fomitiporia mediterranea MF3/22]|uniref:mitochondrial carrier n=1 Tax=Fomitiporia mediterranea (strain MF3/22) TaxID=694068 RepID=UPI0004409430
LQCSPPGTYKGALDCLTKTVRNEGIRALYKGATPPALGWTAIDSVLLGSLHNYRLFLIRHGMTERKPGSDVKRLTLPAHGIAALFAGWNSAIVATPIELVKVKLQMQRQRHANDREFKNPVHCVRRIVQTQGLSGLWTGLTGSLLFRSNFFWMFMSYEVLMRGFGRLEGTQFEISDGLSTFMSGGLASFGFWFMAIPADNVKNRMMAASLGSKRRSAITVAKEILRESGIRGFVRGLTPILLRAFPVNASALFVYEGLMKLMGAEKVRVPTPPSDVRVY